MWTVTEADKKSTSSRYSFTFRSPRPRRRWAARRHPSRHRRGRSRAVAPIPVAWPTPRGAATRGAVRVFFFLPLLSRNGGGRLRVPHPLALTFPFWPYLCRSTSLRGYVSAGKRAPGPARRPGRRSGGAGTGWRPDRRSGLGCRTGVAGSNAAVVPPAAGPEEG
jgi:hypothetical protein